VTQDVDIQLQVWKDLAISKQVLMGAATDALGLDAECSTAELKLALGQAIERARDADIKIQETLTKTEQEVSEYREQAATADKARAEAEQLVIESVTAREQAERQLSIGKSENAESVKKAKAEVVDKQNKLKAISKSLADTPENVVRKLKTLKKQKLDETKLRNLAESKLQTTRKEKNKLEAELETQKPVLEETASLIEQIKSLHALCQKAESTIQKLSDKKKDQIEVPELDQKQLDTLEQSLPKK
jgi:colicin import membrane protein